MDGNLTVTSTCELNLSGKNLRCLWLQNSIGEVLIEIGWDSRVYAELVGLTTTV